jgi:signal transduction histidine kinase
MTSRPLLPPTLALLIACLLIGVFVMLVLPFRQELREEIRARLIERDAAVLYPMVMLQITQSPAQDTATRLTAVLRSAQQPGMLAVALFDADGRPRQALPEQQRFVELPIEDYLALASTQTPLSRFHPQFALDEHFLGHGFERPTAPVLEVLLPVSSEPELPWQGIARYWIDGRALGKELTAIDQRLRSETWATLGTGSMLIGLVVTAGYLGLRRAHQKLAERNERLLRANFELTLAAKASALGQITCHLLHALQGQVAGLRQTVAIADHGGAEDLPSARQYTANLQAMIEETVRLLADATEGTTYELSGDELAATLRQRHESQATRRGINLVVESHFAGRLDNHRCNLLSLIAHNLIENACWATGEGGTVAVELSGDERQVSLRVTDQGTGIPPERVPTLFQPGRSSRPGGSGLGLAISFLLARQIDAELVLVSTGSQGSIFQLTVPLERFESPRHPASAP